MQFGVEKLVRSNYKYWRLCMEAFLQGQDLWDLMAKNDMKMPPDTPDTMEARRKWKVKYGKMLFCFVSSERERKIMVKAVGNGIREYFLYLYYYFMFIFYIYLFLLCLVVN